MKVETFSGTPSRRRRRRSFVAVALMQVAATLVGAALGYAALVGLLLPRLGLGDVQRIVELGRHLDQLSVPREGYVAFLGDSITREGVDAAMVRAASGRPWRVENLALSGCGVNEQRVLLPKLLESRPGVLAIAMKPESLATGEDLPLDKAYAYAMAEFVKAWPPSPSPHDFPDFTPSTLAALRSSSLEQTFHFRTAPLNWVNVRMRSMLREDLRTTTPSEWTRPYQMLANVPPQTLAWHLQSLRNQLQLCKKRGPQGADSIARLVAATRGGGATPVLVLLPIHPRLRDDAAPLAQALVRLLAELADRHQGLVVDAADALSEGQFADAVHPNAEGREAYSRMMGRRLAAPAPSAAVNP